MIDRNKIIAEYNAREAEADNLLGPNHKEIARRVADQLGIPYEDVRNVMLDYWCGPLGAG